jgi:tetratricopeptide (TPR) repeat protein
MGIPLQHVLSSFASSRLPALYGLALAACMGSSWLSNGSVSPPLPQMLANHAYRELWSDDAEGRHGAIEMFRQSLAMDPAFPYRWSDLGDALAAAGRTDSARYCFRRSLELAPNSPQIAMRAANFHFRQGELGPALQLGATVLRITPDYDGMVFNSWVRLGGDLNGILQDGIGANTRAAEAFLRFLIASNTTGHGDEARLLETWNWMERHSSVTRPLATAWAVWLGSRHRDKDAFLVWKRYVARDSAYGAGNWIDNSGFENEPAGQGFDWRLQSSPGVKAALDPAVAHSGHSSLRLEFDGSENPDFHHIAQSVWLPPGRYRLTAWMRTANVLTDQGLALTVFGASTPALTSARDWTRVSADVTVRDNPSLGEVRIVRARSWRFDGKLRGVAWIDDVELRRTE